MQFTVYCLTLHLPCSLSSLALQMKSSAPNLSVGACVCAGPDSQRAACPTWQTCSWCWVCTACWPGPQLLMTKCCLRLESKQAVYEDSVWHASESWRKGRVLCPLQLLFQQALSQHIPHNASCSKQTWSTICWVHNLWYYNIWGALNYSVSCCAVNCWPVSLQNSFNEFSKTLLVIYAYRICFLIESNLGLTCGDMCVLHITSSFGFAVWSSKAECRSY